MEFILYKPVGKEVLNTLYTTNIFAAPLSTGLFFTEIHTDKGILQYKVMK